MIFRTITNEITGANKSIGLFGLSLKNISDKLYEIQTRGFKNVLFNTPSVTYDEKAIRNYIKAIEQGIPAQNALASASKNTNQATIALMQSTNGAIITQEQLTAAQKASTLAARLQSKAFKALSVAGNMLLFTAIAKGIQLATTALDNWINRSKYAIEAMEKAQQSINDAQNKLKDVSATIEENKDRFLELSKGVDKFSKNIKLSEKDYAEYLSISNKLAEISPELVTGYTEQGDALLYIGDNAEETSEKLNKVLEAQQALAQQSLVDNMDSVAKGIYYEVDKANSDIANLEAELNTVSTVFRDLDNIIKTVNDDVSSIDFGTGSGLELDFDEMEQLKNAIRNSGAKITEDDVFDSMIFSSSDIPLVQKAIENFYKQLDYTRKNESAAYINGITKDIQERENAIKDAYAKMAPNLVAWAKSTYEYDFLGEQQQKLIDSLIPTLDWNDIKEKTGVKLGGGAEYEQYIKDNIIVPLMSIPDEYQNEVNKKFAKLLEFESGDIGVVDFVSELQDYLDNIGVSIDIKPLISDVEDLNKDYTSLLNSVKSKFGDTFEIETDSLNEARENLEYEFQKLSDWGLEDYSGFVQNGVQSIFGNVDMDKRTIITWSDELKQTYADALASWDYEPDIGGIDTVFGGSGRFGEDINGTGWEVAFTPILPDGTFLSSDTVYEYIESIVAEAYSQNGEVTENALKSIDAQGRQIGDTFVHGIFAAVDDSLDYDNNGNLAETVGRLMHFTGNFGAIKLAKQEIEDARQVINWDSWFSANVKTPDEIELFQKIIQEAYNAIDAVKQYKSATSGLSDTEPILSTITSSIEQIATQLEPQFKKLGDAYKDIFTADGFTLDAVDNSMLEDLRKSFAEIKDEIGVTFDTAQLEDFFAVLSNSNSTAEQTQEVFDKIATSYLYSTDVLESLNNTTVNSIAKQLESLGIVNASEVATQALAAKEEYLAFARREHVDETGNLVNVTQDLANATADDINVLIAEQDVLEGEGIALDEATQKMIAYWMQKQTANGQLSTVGDIQQLGALCEALGVSSKALRNYIYFKQLASMTDVYDAASIERFSANAEKNMEQAQADIQSIYGKLGGAEINFAVSDTSKKSGSSSKSEKDTTKPFDWIQQAIENVEKEVNKLDDVVNSAYSTFSQKNEALAKEIGKVNEEIELQQQAYDEYMRKADSIGLGDDYKTLIHDGAVNIENISDKNLQEKISEYQQWYEKAVDASDAISELSTKVKDLHVAGYELQADRIGELLDNESITEKQYLSEMKKLYKEYYENQTDYAQKAHEAKLALLDREKQYLNSVANAATSLLDKEINKVQDNAKEQQKPYEDQIKAAEKQIDAYEDQIKVFEKQIDAHNKQIDAYNKEIDLINDRKKPLQDELDALEDKAREENLILGLQEKQYNLKKAENQRDKLVNYMPDAIVI